MVTLYYVDQRGSYQLAACVNCKRWECMSTNKVQGKCCLTVSPTVAECFCMHFHPKETNPEVEVENG